MINTTKLIALTILSILVTGCAPQLQLNKGYVYTQSQINSNEESTQQIIVKDRYILAFESIRIKDYVYHNRVLNVCNPKIDDKGYVKCIHDAELEILTYVLFPDLFSSFLKELVVFKEQLIRKEINREEFRKNILKITNYYIMEMGGRVKSDGRAGIYTGNNKY